MTGRASVDGTGDRNIKLLIIGAGSHGHVVSDIIRSMPISAELTELGGYLDDRYGDQGWVADHPILGTVPELPRVRIHGLPGFRRLKRVFGSLPIEEIQLEISLNG